MYQRARRFLLLMLAATLPLFFYNNCGGSNVNFSRNEASNVTDGGSLGGAPTPVPNNPPADVFVTCKNSTPKVKEVDVFFPNPNVTCDFGRDGNLPRQETHLTARIEQSYNLAVNLGDTICDLDFVFLEQSFRYDDHFLFTFNDRVLASSYDFQTILDRQTDFFVYNWTKIAGAPWDTRREMVYCPLQTGLNPEAVCKWPNTDVPGKIDLQYSPLLIQKIIDQTKGQMNHFKFISIGDNDDLDCEHSDIRFKVRIHYIEQE